MSELRAFHGEQGLKEMYLARVLLHREADQLIQRDGWNGSRGCAIGCTLENYDHAQYPIELGVPLVLAYLEDRIFECLPVEDAMMWPERFLDAIPVGADLSDVWPQFVVWLLVDHKKGVIRFAKNDQTRKAITDVADLWRERAPASDQRWIAARRAADAACACACADADAAYACACASAYAANANANANARFIHWQACADKLEELLKACGQPMAGKTNTEE